MAIHDIVKCLAMPDSLLFSLLYLSVSSSLAAHIAACRNEEPTLFPAFESLSVTDRFNNLINWFINVFCRIKIIMVECNMRNAKNTKRNAIEIKKTWLWNIRLYNTEVPPRITTQTDLIAQQCPLCGCYCLNMAGNTVWELIKLFEF